MVLAAMRRVGTRTLLRSAGRSVPHGSRGSLTRLLGEVRCGVQLATPSSTRAGVSVP